MIMKTHRIVRYLILSGFLSCCLCTQGADLSSALRASYAAEAKRDYATALKALTEVLITDNRNYFLQMRAGYLNLMLGKYPASGDAYEAAADLEPRTVEAALGALKANAAAGDMVAAEKWAQAVLSQDPKNYTGLSRLAYAYFMKKDYAQALDYYQRVVELYPSDLDMKNGLAWSAFYMGNKSKAQTLFLEVLSVSPDNSSAAQGLAASKK
jgi:tetratricopeptide (TPR) repeat protein